jgi:hypothetical protein
MVRVGEGVDVSVALTVNVSTLSSLTVSVEGRVMIGGTCVPRKVKVAVAV